MFLQLNLHSNTLRDLMRESVESYGVLMVTLPNIQEYDTPRLKCLEAIVPHYTTLGLKNDTARHNAVNVIADYGIWEKVPGRARKSKMAVRFLPESDIAKFDWLVDKQSELNKKKDAKKNQTLELAHPDHRKKFDLPDWMTEEDMQAFQQWHDHLAIEHGGVSKKYVGEDLREIKKVIDAVEPEIELAMADGVTRENAVKKALVPYFSSQHGKTDIHKIYYTTLDAVNFHAPWWLIANQSYPPFSCFSSLI